MIDTFFRINFASDSSGEEAFEEILTYLDTECESGYLRLRDSEASLRGDLDCCDLIVQESTQHLFNYDSSLAVLSVDCGQIIQEDNKGKLETVISFVKEVYDEIGFKYVFGIHQLRMERIDAPGAGSLPSPVSEESLSRDRIEFPTWLMLFSPAMVEQYRSEWIRDLPAARIEELDDGAFIIVATEDIFGIEQNDELHSRINDSMHPLEEAFSTHDP